MSKTKLQEQIKAIESTSSKFVDEMTKKKNVSLFIKRKSGHDNANKRAAAA